MVPATFRASFGFLLRHPWQLACAVLGICVGVAVIIAVDLANSSARKAFLLSMDAITGKATHQVVGGPRGVPEGVYAALRVQHGIRAIAPVIEGEVRIGASDLTMLGIDLFAEREIRDFALGAHMDAGNSNSSDVSLLRGFLTEAGAVATSRQTAEELGLQVGRNFNVLAGGASRTARLTTVFDGDNGRERLLLTDIATAQEWLGMAGSLSRIDVRISGDESMLDDLEAVLPAGTQVLSAAGRTRSTADMSEAFMTNLTAMSLLALLVGVFLIFNSVSFSVLQRRGLIGVLRLLGLTRRQLVTLVLAEAGLVGLIASVLGVALGIALADALLDLVSRTINDLYFRVVVTGVQIDMGSIFKGLGAGIFAALLAAVIPAWEATSYQPRLALARSVLEGRTRGAVPLVTFTGVALMVTAVILIAFSGTGLGAGLTAVFLLVLGFSLLIPAFTRGGIRLLSPWAGRMGGVAARMAISGISAGLSRTAVAIVALTVAVSATVGVSVMVDSFRVSVSDWLKTTLQADLYVGAQYGSMDSKLVEAVRAAKGVEALSTLRGVWLEDERGRTQLRAIEMAPGSYAGTEILGGEPTEIWPSWESEDVVLVSEPYAFQRGVGAGDFINLPTDSGERAFEIGAVFQSYDVNASAVMMSRATYDRLFQDDAIDSVGIYLEEGVSVEDAMSTLRQLNGGDQILRVTSNADLRRRSLQIFDRTFVITDVLYWLALGVALVGILSAMLALQLERAREFATLRALGMTTRQVGGLIVTQTGVIGLLSGLASIPLGLVMALVLIKVINRRAFGWTIDMSVRPEMLVTAVVFAVGTAVLAGLYPAWRAGRSQPAIAMREE